MCVDNAMLENLRHDKSLVHRVIGIQRLLVVRRCTILIATVLALSSPVALTAPRSYCWPSALRSTLTPNAAAQKRAGE